jgi:hypothetical protein
MRGLDQTFLINKLVKSKDQQLLEEAYQLICEKKRKKKKKRNTNSKGMHKGWVGGYWGHGDGHDHSGSGEGGDGGGGGE